jgi:hypothetical protein
MREESIVVDTSSSNAHLAVLSYGMIASLSKPQDDFEAEHIVKVHH